MKIQLYLGGDRLLFGLPGTPSGLAAYLDMLEGTGLAWMAAVFGGDIVASGIAALTIEKGGHVRVGLEDHHAPPRQARNVELVAEIAALCRAAAARRPPWRKHRRPCSADGPSSLTVAVRRGSFGQRLNRCYRAVRPRPVGAKNPAYTGTYRMCGG